MKYYIGFGFAFLLIYIVAKLQARHNIFNEPRIKTGVRQSEIYLLSLSMEKFPKIKNKVKKQRQSTVYDAMTNIKVIIMDNQAYWIKNNVFYTANMEGDNVDKDTTRRVDTMTMNKVQLDKMMFIIDRLREGTLNDSGGTGY